MTCRSGFDYIAVNYGNSFIENLGPEEIDALRGGELHSAFLKRAIDSKKITIPEEFGEGTVYGDYVAAGAMFSDTCMYAKGFIKVYDWSKPTIQSDWTDYVMAIVSNSAEYLGSYEWRNMMSSDWWTSNKGILNDEAKDYNGLVRKKYDIVIKYFKDVYGVNLQRIGDK